MRRTLQTLTISLGSLFVLACTVRQGVTRRTLVFEDGSPAAYIDCPSNERLCVDEARRMCPGGYDVLASSEGTGVVPRGSGRRTPNPGRGTTIVVACEGARARASKCGDRTGNYQVSRVPRSSTCGNVLPSEIVVLDDVPDEQRPCRTTQRSPDGCELRTVDDCVQAGRRGLVVETTNWSTDTSTGAGAQQYQLYDVATGTLLCSGVYDVTYTRL
jgi:hypothetical protein